MSGALAIVGIACRYAEAASPWELWLNVLAQRRSFRRIPSQRLRLEDYHSTDAGDPDRTYSARAAVIENWELDRTAFRISADTYHATDATHWLALDVATRALEDAGFRDGDGLPRESTGVVVGNTLTGEFTRANLLRLRWPYVRRVVDAALVAEGEGWPAAERARFLATLEEAFKSPFPPFGEDSLAGALSNTIAGRICNHHDLKGGGYTVDAACAASLLAVTEACSRLAAGDLDVALAGGVDLSLDPLELVGFSRVGALATGEMRIFDERPTGFLPGEGCGFVVLMREADALAAGRRIYARIRGWGVSSDGSGGLTRPEAAGQVLAFERAYRRAGFAPGSVTYFEGHGTGTAAGDRAELEALVRMRRESGGDGPPACLGSVKANIGHAKAAAGVAGLIKATLALHRRIVPPTTGCRQPRPEVTGEGALLDVPRIGFEWPEDRPLRAGVSAMGFGGINTHVVLDADEAGPTPRRSAEEARAMRSAQDAELILLAGEDAGDLLAQVERVARVAPGISDGALADLAAELWRSTGRGGARAALVVSSPEDLVRGLEMLDRLVREGRTSACDVRRGAFLQLVPATARVGLLFSGQGAPVRLTPGLLGERFDVVRAAYERVGLRAGSDPGDPRVAQRAIVTASLAGLELLRDLGVDADLALGHSLGELTALHWGGVLSEEALVRIVSARAAALAGLDGAKGSMAAVLAPPERVAELLHEDVVIACLNGARETVVAGESGAVEAFLRGARNRGLAGVPLAVTHAFHSPLVAGAGAPLARALAAEPFASLRGRVLSGVTGRELTQADDLRDLLVRHLTAPVRFAEIAREAAESADVLIEVGAGDVLSRLMRDIASSHAIPLDVGGPSVAGLLGVAGALFVRGARLKAEVLFAERHGRPFDLDATLSFLANPCERAPLPADATPATSPARNHPEAPAPLPPGDVTNARPLDVVIDLIASHAGLPREAVEPSHRLLADLHLNSLTAARLIAEASRRLGVPPLSPLEFVGATVAQVAGILEGLARSRSHPAEADVEAEPPGIDAWVRAFAVDLVERAAPPAAHQAPPGRDWLVLGGSADPGLGPALDAAAPGGGVAACLPPQGGADDWELVLEAARVVTTLQPPARLVIVQHGSGASALARGIHVEARLAATCVIDLPADHPHATRLVAAEASAMEGFREVHYDAQGRRREPVLRALREEDLAPLHPPPGPLDVLLVTGGGKGIAAECALGLARSSGARVALIGRSLPQDDAELAANLERFEAAGVVASYAAADVTDREATLRAVGRLQETLGPVTMFLHGAGLNEPRPLASVDRQAVLAALGPKVTGALNILEGIDAARLRLFVAFGSIIARTGLPGEAHYGLANERLRQLVEDWQDRNASCRCLCIEWSAWSGTGMAERLASLEPLARRGITPITVDAGVALFRRLVGTPPRRTSVVVSGRWGREQTLALAPKELPLLRFVETPRAHYPGVELVIDVAVDSGMDPYVDDHVLEGKRLFPAVMGLEAMAQAAMALAGADAPPSFLDVRFDRALTVPSGGQVLRLAALSREDGRIDVVIRSRETGFKVDHFLASCAFDRGMPDDAPPRDEPSTEGAPVDVDPARDLYGSILFQGGRFLRLERYRQLSSVECRADLLPAPRERWFGRYLPQRLVLGDPGGRDAVIHAIQACYPHATLLPISVDRVELRGGTSVEIRSMHSREIAVGERMLQHDVMAFDEDGRLVERWRGLKLRVLDGRPRSGAWTPALLGPHAERRFADLFPGTSIRATLLKDATEPTDRLIADFVGGIEVRRRPDGRPETLGGPAVSVSHAAGLTLLAAARVVGCDIQPVGNLPDAEWRDLLGAALAQTAELIASATGESSASASTRAWCVLECLAKAGLPRDTPLVLRTVASDGWVALAAGPARVACGVASVEGAGDPLVIALLAGATDASS